MKTASEYRAMAEECFRWAREAHTKEVCESYVQLAQVWLHRRSVQRRQKANQSGDAVSLGMAARRFPPLWTVEERSACFVVRDHNGQALTYIYFEDEP